MKAIDAQLEVQSFWEAEPCGSRYGAGHANASAAIADTRYRIEPHIVPFADFPSAAGKTVLEIGVGAGSDFARWVENADHATGIDLTDAGIAATRRRLAGVDPARYTLQQANAEALPFASNSFDIVYSYGVLHHTPDTRAAFHEAFRVLRPGGVLKAMVYQPYSWVGLMLWVRYGLAFGNPGLSFRQAMFRYLESPGTKAYTIKEAREVLRSAGFRQRKVWTRLSPADLLETLPSAKHRRLSFVWKLYPRPLVRLLGHRFGTHLLMEARKPGHT